MINNAGELVDHVHAAVQQANATPLTEMRVRIGNIGPEYRIHQLVASQDQRGLCLILQTSIKPVG